MRLDMSEFLTRVDQCLREQGRHRKWLAEQIGMSHNTIYSWFHHHRSPPLDAAVAMADALDVSLGYLIYGSEVATHNNIRDTVHVSIDVPASIYERLRQQAQDEDRPVEMQIVHNIRQCLPRDE